MTEKIQSVLRKQEDGQVVFGELRIAENLLKTVKQQSESLIRLNSRAETLFMLDADMNYLNDNHIEILVEGATIKQVTKVELALSFYVAAEAEENLTHQHDTLHICDEDCTLRVTEFKANKTGKLAVQVAILEANKLTERLIQTNIDVVEGQVIQIDGKVSKNAKQQGAIVKFTFVNADSVLGKIDVKVLSAVSGVRVDSSTLNVEPEVKDKLAKLILKIPAEYNFEIYDNFYSGLQPLTEHLSVGTTKLADELIKLYEEMEDFYDGRRKKYEGKFIQLLKLINLDLVNLPVYEDKKALFRSLVVKEEVKPTLATFVIRNKDSGKNPSKHRGLELNVTEGETEEQFTVTKTGKLALTVLNSEENPHILNLKAEAGDVVKVTIEAELLNKLKGYATAKITLVNQRMHITEFVTFKATSI